MLKKHDINHSISNFLMVDECLLDARRVAFFQRAIKTLVKPGQIVVDAGTGTGIIALLAAKQGATVYAVEKDPQIANIARENIRANKMGHKVKVINQDVLEFKLPKGQHADVVTMEMLDTGLVAEQQAQALIELRKNGVIVEDSILLPDKIDCLLRAVEYDFNFYGFNIPIVIQARNYGAIERVKTNLSILKSYAGLDFKTIKSTKVESIVEIAIEKNGLLNAIELKSHIYLAGKRYSDTSDMNMPVVIPLNEKRVKKGDKIRIKIKYNMGLGFNNFKANIL